MANKKTNLTQTTIAFKKISGVTTTTIGRTELAEPIASTIQASTDRIFGEVISTNDIPSESYATDTNNIVQKVEFDIVAVKDTTYKATDFDDDAESSTATTHSFALKLKDDYETLGTDNPKAGTDPFTNGYYPSGSGGALQLVPPFYNVSYSISLTNQDGDAITTGDDMDWYMDYYSGIVFRQDGDNNSYPVSASGYIYIGDYASSTTGFPFTGSAEITGSLYVDGPITASDLFVDGPITASGDVNFQGNFSLPGISNVSESIADAAELAGTLQSITDRGASTTQVMTASNGIATSVLFSVSGSVVTGAQQKGPLVTDETGSFKFYAHNINYFSDYSGGLWIDSGQSNEVAASPVASSLTAQYTNGIDFNIGTTKVVQIRTTKAIITGDLDVSENLTSSNSVTEVGKASTSFDSPTFKITDTLYTDPATKIYQNNDYVYISGSGVVPQEHSSFPSNPPAGALAIKDGVLYVAIET